MGQKLMYGFNHRHHGSIQKMKQLIDDGQYGKILDAADMEKM